MQPFKKILLVSLEMNIQKGAIKQAVNLAHYYQAVLHVLIIYPNLPPALSEYCETYEQAIFKNMQHMITDCKRELKFTKKMMGQINIEVVGDNRPNIYIIQKVLREGYDLIFKEAEMKNNKGFKAIDMGLLRKCPCPVWLYRPNKHRLKALRIAVAIDPKNEENASHEIALKLLKIGDALAKLVGKSFFIISCWHYPLENTLRSSPFARIPENQLRELISQEKNSQLNDLNILINEAVLENSYHIKHLKGIPEKIIPKFIDKEEIDVLIMGTVGRTGIPGFLIGNTAENVLQKLSCSLIALKPEKFVSPVKLDK